MRLLTAFAILAFSAPAFAQTQQQPNLEQQLQKFTTSKNGKSNIGQVLAVGTLLGCTQKKVGQQATQAFYEEMNTTGKAIEVACKQGKPDEAKKLALATLEAKKNDPVVQAALNCYTTQQQQLDALAGPKVAADAANYADWLRHPEAAKQKIESTDICKNSSKSTQ